MPVVTRIEPTRNPLTVKANTVTQKRRVAGYARVSTEKDEQFTSYEAQIEYYTDYIKRNVGWEFVEVYTDEGITGTSTKHRAGFNRMVEDALAGKIDLIITKSVSRFARNTVDSLTTIRKLKEHGIECYFEKENIWTFDSKGELLITIMSSLAQEESRSISGNVTWGIRQSMSKGKVTVPFSSFLGYDRGVNGELIINPGQAMVVRRIYGLFMQGFSTNNIAHTLEAEGVASPTGKERWFPSTIMSILKNEKYKGDALLQKTYTEDYLSKKKIINNGEVPQYYVTESHEGIISKELFELVQKEIIKRNSGTKQENHSGKYLFSSRVKCGHCGAWFGPKTWNPGRRDKHLVWLCNARYKKSINSELCPTPILVEDDLKRIFIKAMNTLVKDNKNVICSLDLVKDTALVVSGLEMELNEWEHEIQKVSEMLKTEQDDETRDRLLQRNNLAQDRLNAIQAEVADRNLRRCSIESFLNELLQQAEPITEFSDTLWYTLVDYMTVYGNGEYGVTFKDGTEIRVTDCAC